MKLHEKIAWYRRDRRLSQEELAAQIWVFQYPQLVNGRTGIHLDKDTTPFPR